MDVVYWLQGLAFEWDAQKAQLNIAQHSVRNPGLKPILFE
jgi:uncharacterized DUF497 family protein